MMTREKFKDLVYKMLGHSEFYNKLYELGIDVIECKYMDTAGIFFDEIMGREFGDEGLDLITWWMYEETDHVIYDPDDKTKVIADINKIDDLYKYLADGGRDAVSGEE